MIDDPKTELGNEDFGPEDWGIAGYEPPKTSLAGSRITGPGIGKRICFTDSVIKLRPNTDPCKYSDTLEVTQKKYWLSKEFKFGKANRETQTLQAIKRSKSTPGPGEYYKDDGEKKKKMKFKLGLFSKGERGCFLDGVVAASQQVPSCHKYRPQCDFKTKFPNTIYHKPYFVKPPAKKDEIGPGSYSEIEQAITKHILRKSSTFVNFKSKRLCFAQVKAKQKNFVPGAGAYTVTQNTISFKAEKSKIPEDRQRIIKKNSNVLRTTDKIVKEKDWVPGPGTYYVTPKPIKPSK